MKPALALMAFTAALVAGALYADWRIMRAARHTRDQAQAELDACLEVVQLQQAWAEVYTAKNDHWLTMSAEEKARTLERERALWAATQRVLTERRGS